MTMEPKHDPTRGAPDVPPPTSPTCGDYLWDKSGTPDPEIVQLEQTLALLRRSETPHANASVQAAGRRTPGRDEHARKRRSIAPALFMLVFIVVVAYFAWPMRPWGPGTQRLDPHEPGVIDAPELATTVWEATKLDGAPTVGTKSLVSKQSLRINQWLYTDKYSSAKLSAQFDSGSGSVTVQPDSKVRVTKVEGGEHWLELARGRIDAVILAPPKLFFVETKSALAVDMGCAYSLEVDDKGDGMLHVTAGWVELQRDGKAIRVPRGNKCAIRSNGPGTPITEHASDRLLAAVMQFDSGQPTKSDPIGDILSIAAKDDAVTLWHLLRQAPENRRADVIDKLASLVQSPDGVSRESLEKLDAAALDEWWDDIRFR